MASRQTYRNQRGRQCFVYRAGREGRSFQLAFRAHQNRMNTRLGATSSTGDIRLWEVEFTMHRYKWTEDRGDRGRWAGVATDVSEEKVTRLFRSAGAPDRASLAAWGNTIAGSLDDSPYMHELQGVKTTQFYDLSGVRDGTVSLATMPLYWATLAA